MVTTAYKQAASKAYLEHIRDVNELAKHVDVYMFVARACGMKDVEFERQQEQRLDAYLGEVRAARIVLANVKGIAGTVLEMWLFEGKSYAAIGHEIGYEVSSIKRHAKIGREQLYKYLPPEYQ